MDKDIALAAIGVAGTLLGTLFGWALNSFSNRGKLNLFVSGWKDEFMSRAGGYSTLSKSIEEARGYKYSLSLDLYNSSALTKIMRDIKIIFTDDKSVLWSGVPDDKTTEKFTAGTVWYNKIEPVNIPPKTVIKLCLRDCIWNSKGEMDFIWNARKVYLQYTDEKNRRRKKLIPR